MNWCLEQNPRHCPDITSHKWVPHLYTTVYLPHTDWFKASSRQRAGYQRKWQKRCSSLLLWVISLGAEDSFRVQHRHTIGLRKGRSVHVGVLNLSGIRGDR